MLISHIYHQFVYTKMTAHLRKIYEIWLLQSVFFLCVMTIQFTVTSSYVFWPNHGIYETIALRALLQVTTYQPIDYGYFNACAQMINRTKSSYNRLKPIRSNGNYWCFWLPFVATCNPRFM